MFASCLVGRVDFERIVAASFEPPDLFVRQIGDQRFEPRIRAEKVLADVATRFDRVLLVLSVDDFVHTASQNSVRVLFEKGIPVRAPYDLDHIPSGTAERAFQLLDNFAVPAYWSVEALQVAVDDEDQVVEPLASREVDRPKGLGLVALAIAQEGRKHDYPQPPARFRDRPDSD